MANLIHLILLVFQIIDGLTIQHPIVIDNTQSILHALYGTVFHAPQYGHLYEVLDEEYFFLLNFHKALLDRVVLPDRLKPSSPNING